MNFPKLVDLTDPHIWAGTVFRFPAKKPFEDYVDFMLIFDTHSDSGFSLICTSGRKAGNFEGKLPKTALATGKVRAIDKSWLIQNWTDYVYLHCRVDDVHMLPHYPEPSSLADQTDIKTRFADWTDLDVAAYHIAIALGLMQLPPSGYGPFDFGGRKDIFWTDNPIGNLIFRLLGDMVAIGALQVNPNDDQLIRWNAGQD